VSRAALFGFICLLLAPLDAATQGQRYVFEKLKGVRHKYTPTSLASDEYGRIWFSSLGRGAFCYDGYNFIRYRTDSDNPQSLINDRVYCLLPDRKQRVWLATLEGLCVLDRRTDKVTRIPWYQDTIRQFHTVYEDKTGAILVGSNKGIFVYDEVSGKLNKLARIPEAPMRGFTRAFFEDRNGTLWAGRSDGLYRISSDRKQFEKINLQSREKNETAYAVNTFLGENSHAFWLGTDQGLFLFDPMNLQVQRSVMPDSVAHRRITTLLKTPDSVMWIGTQGHGLIKWDVQNGGFLQFVNNPLDPHSLAHNHVHCLEYDRFGNLWIGAGNDVMRFDLQQKAFTLWPIFPEDPVNNQNAVYRMAEDRSGGLVVSSTRALYYFEKPGAAPQSILVEHKKTAATDFHQDKEGRVWAVIRGALYVWNVADHLFERYKTPPLPGELLNVVVDAEDPQILWLGTQKGLSRFDRRSGELRSCTQFSPPNFDQYVRRFADDGQGSLWLDLPDFLGKFDKKTFKTRLFNSDSLPPYRLVNNEILDVLVAPDGWVWVTTTGGITTIDPVSGHFHNITRKNGLPDNVVNTLLFDPNGDTWAVLPETVVRIKAVTRALSLFSTENVFQATTWTRGRCQLRDGRLVYATLQGFVLLDPEKLKEKVPASRILLTNFEVSGTEREIPTAPEFLENIQLRSEENNITLEWAGIQLAQAAELRYECKLERKGKKSHWEQKGYERQAVYANLDPGPYTFRVRVAGSESPELVLHFAIAPAWYQADSFKMLLMALFVTAAYLFWRNREDNRELLQQKELAEQNARYKTRFLANMSHEIRTPMNAIVGLSRLLTESELPPRQREYSEAIRQSSENLLVIVNDVLDQAKIESGKFKFQQKLFDLTVIIRHLQNTIGLRAAEKGLGFDLEIAPGTPVKLIGDPVRLNQILTNLMGNAIKFTESGQVTLQVQGPQPGDQPPLFTFTITDTGIGIEAAQLDKVFESFQQADDEISSTYGGTGLGLSITKDLVEQQGGVIKLESTPGAGTRVEVKLPIQTGKEEEVLTPMVVSTEPVFEHLRVLLVEDTYFNQMLAIELLKSRIPGVQIELAENGAIALEKVENDGAFDLILMDIKMPVMDGLEATRRIRSKTGRQRYPIIALTANAVPGELEKCREAGMDALVTKPVDAQELFSTMYQLLQQS
jgi:signal transduction histidine kinase/ligand-binding sensor domain-containing protein/CheY-like chemotaxis protein